MYENIKELQPKGLCITHSDEKIQFCIDNYFSVLKQIKEEYIPKYNSDLIEIRNNPTCCCPECAKYMRRVYSLTGLDNRFPIFPKWLIDTKCAHCGIRISVCHEGILELFDCIHLNGDEPDDVFDVSNRPFIDDRPQEYIDYYYKIISDYEEEVFDSNIYPQLIDKCPEFAPKTYTAYRRMKKQKSKGYLKLVEEARKVGIELPI